jgi:hypothetical protein
MSVFCDELMMLGMVVVKMDMVVLGRETRKRREDREEIKELGKNSVRKDVFSMLISLDPDH